MMIFSFKKAFTLAEGDTHTDIFALKRIAAFNLAEVLITLGIIGIIAAITLPALINKRQNKVLEAQFKKSYSQLSQVIQSVVMDEYGSIVEIKNDEVTNFVNYISKRYVKTYSCKRGRYWTDMFEDSNFTSADVCVFIRKIYKTLNNKSGDARFNDAIISVIDGSTIYFDVAAEGETTYGSVLVALDVNGWKNKPNRYGYDFFVFLLEKDGKLTPMGADGSLFPEETYCSKTSAARDNGYGCTIKAFTDPHYFSNL